MFKMNVLLIPIPERVMFPSVRSQIRLSPSDLVQVEEYLLDNGGGQVVVCGTIESKVQVVGTLCRITAREGQTIHIEGLSRAKIIGEMEIMKLGSLVRTEVLSDSIPASDVWRPLISETTHKLNELLKLSSNKSVSKFPSAPGAIVNVVSVALLASNSITVSEAQSLLEESDLVARIKRVNSLLTRAVEAAKIRSEVNQAISRKHNSEMRRILIKRQISELQAQLKNLGAVDDDDGSDEVGKLRKKLTELPLPDEVERIVEKELKRLDSIQSHHPEYPGIITYLETISMLPWAVEAVHAIDLKRAKTELDTHHYGLEKVKTRILEFLSVEKLRNKPASSVLCLHGNPGVGKTSIVESIARSMNRKFVRISLSGVRDESELRGHRKTYIGAMAGLVIQSLIRAGSSHCVILLDEVDKVSSIGNPAGRAGSSGGAGNVLLELLDPEQNKSFRDAFLNFGFDLSHCLFVCTCNSLSAVSRPLLDRLDVVTIEGYTDVEKLEIAKRHLIGNQMELNGLVDRVKIVFSDEVILKIIAEYTHEAGVRNLNRRIGDICRHFALKEANNPHNNSEVSIKVGDLKALLGLGIAEGPLIPATLPVGVSLGLAVSSTGGDVLFIESVITGKSTGDKGAVTVTGQLGDVMKESVRTALSLLMSRSLSRFSVSHENSVYRNIDPALVRSSDVHVHFPTGSVQKDGPSAGVSTSIALASLFSGINAPSDLASTGEITLRGDVLPIGGVKQKLIAAHRAGLKTVLIPYANKSSLEDVPDEVLRSVSVVLVRNIDEVMRAAFPQSAAPSFRSAL